MAIAAAVIAGVFVPGQSAWAAPDVESGSEAAEPELDRGPDGLQAPDAASALTIARLEGEKVEVLGERTDTSSTWALPDGTMTMGRAAAPVWVRQGDGDGTAAADWAPVDLTLVVTPEGDVAPVSYPADLTLAGGGVPESGALVTLANGDGEQVSIAWTEELPAPRLEGPRAVYEDVQPGVDMVVEATRTGYEQFFVLTEAPEDPEALDLLLQVRTEGLETSTDEDGGVQFTDTEGAVLGHSGTPLVWDAEVDAERQHPITEPFVVPEPIEGTLSSGLPAVPDYGPAPEPGEPSITELEPGEELDTEGSELPLPEAAENLPEVAEGAGQATSAEAVQAEASDALPLPDAAQVVAPGAVDLVLTPGAEFLTDPETTYPVVVDPEAYFAYGFDTYVQSGTNTDQSGSGELRLGTYNSGTNVARSFINFNLADVRQKLILDARLDLYMTHSYSCQARNWEVWDTGLAGPGTRWNAQPGWVNRQATLSATTGWGSGCEDGWVTANLTNLVQAWSNQNYSDVALGLRATDERDTYGWKKFNSADAGWGVPALYVRWNTPPGPAGSPGVAPMNFDGPPSSNVSTPTLSAVVNDADGAAYLFFEVRRSSDEGVVWSGWSSQVPNGSVGSVTVPPGVLAEGGSYFMRVHTWDDIQWNTGYSQSGVWTVDQTAPAAPAVASSAYPSDQTWHGAENQAGNFDLTLPAADGTLSGYEWALDAVPSTKVAASGNTTISITPPTNGVHVLQVRTIDRAANRSPIVKYTFNVGRAGVVSPVEGAQVVRKVALTITSELAFTHAQYWWRRGPDATDSYPIDIAALTKPDGSPLAAWSPRTSSQTVSTFGATWDASFTLGDVPGPVQVSARVATDANGAGAYQTAWVNLTVSPDAAYAATDAVGPGTVNLLTGEYTLSATDVDEFGLALGRTTSSRDPRSGLELQSEMLPEAMQTIADSAAFSGNAVTVEKATNRWHRGGSSLRLTATGATDDSFAIANTALPLRRGSAYRVSAWVYVPSATGLVTSATSWAQRLNVLYQAAGGGYVHETSTRAVITDSWQYITMDVTIPAGAASDGQFRLYNGSGTNGAQVFYDDLSVREIWAPLGPQWSLGTADGTTGTAYSHITQPYPDVASLHLSGGGEIWFTEGSDGRWWPESGAEGLTLTKTLEDQWRLTELDGTVSVFAVGVTSVLRPDQQLFSDQSLSSTNGAYRLSMQSDGNLVIYRVNLATGGLTPTWALSWQPGITPAPGSRLSMQSDGNLVVYRSDNTPVWYTTTGQPVNNGSRLVMQSDGNLVIYRPNNTYTWASRTREENLRPSDTIARLISSSPPAATGQTRLVYESVNGRMRLTRLIAPIQPGVDNWPTNTAACTTATPADGCQVQELVYATGGTPSSTTSTSFGNYADRLIEVKLWSSTPTQAMGAVSVVRYAYDDRGMLREVWDPRISPALKTAYTYDGDGRVLTVTGAGELPWRFTYGTGGARSTIGNGDLIDRSSGRLLSVTRASLQQTNPTATGPDNTSTVVYNVPLNRAAGGPYDLNAAALATWAQTRGPTDATAIFGPEDVPTVTTATSTTPGANGYKPAVVHYLDASGREVNTATPVGPDAPAAGFIDTAEYDRFGNVVRTLDATNRLLALGQLPTATADLAALSLSSADTATRALALSGLSAFSADGLDLVRTRGPLVRVAIGNNPSDVRLAHAFTGNAYDEGKPDGYAYHLLTTGTEGVVVPAADWRAGALADLTAAGQLFDVETTVNGYNPIDGASPIGPTSGWVIGSPTVVTGDAGAGGANLVSRVRYDAQGRAVESRKVGSDGTDAGTVRSVFYTAGTNPDRAACGSNAHYAGLPCATYNAGSTTGSDTARMATGLPVRMVSAYNRYGSIAAVTETATGPLAGSTITQSRTTTTTYDDADRVTSVAITTAGAGVTPSAIPKTTTTYDPTSGDVTAVSTVDANGTVLSRTAKVFDALGRMTSYTDAAGAVTTTEFDRYGKPVLVTDSTHGTTTRFTYDRTVEPRGYATKVEDSVGGIIVATYGPDGQVLTQSLPGGVQLRIAYDAGRTPISRTYVRTSDNAVISSSAVVENGSGQFVTHTTSASSKTYAYDRLGRLTTVTDLTAGIASCTTRAYTYGNRAERTSRAVNRSANSTCPTATGTGSTSTSYSYDSGDRLVLDTATGAAGWVYDPLGRIVDAPVASNPGARVQNAYWANDLIASQTITNVARQTWTLDPLQRFSEFTSETWMNNAWQQAVTKVNHYDSDSDSPAWISEDKSLPNEITRYVDGLDGSLAMQTGKTGARVLQLIDLQGSVMTTLPIADGATTATWTGIRHQTADEFGAPTDLTTGRARISTGASPDKTNRYGWLGGAQRSTQALAGVTLMGVRLYDPNTGRFWSTDPVPGGNATTYDYCSGDPVNCTDLDGRWSLGGFLKKAVKVAAVVGEIASNIPGPIGTAAAGISAVAYAVQGNKSKAIEMGITAAAAMIPGGSAIVKAGARAVRAAGNVAARAGRAVVKVVKGCNSFTPDTGVLLANGSVIPIADVAVGDMVTAMDPTTGQISQQPVLNVIVGAGVKHLVTVTTAADDGAQASNIHLGVEQSVVDTWTGTANHPIWVVGRGWVDAVELHLGDRTVAASGDMRTVVAVIDQGEIANQLVLNLSVANVHTYLVGSTVESSTLVHNTSCSLLASSSRAARADVMRAAGIPRSLRPTQTFRSQHGRAELYDVPGRGQYAVVHGRTDRSHPGAPHWEAGPAKRQDGRWVPDSLGRPRLSNTGKVKRYY